MKPNREFRIAINLGYGQVFTPEHLERTSTAHEAARSALARYLGADLAGRLGDLVPTVSGMTGRHLFTTYGQDKAFLVIVDDLAEIGAPPFNGRLEPFARRVLRVLEEHDEWSSDTLDQIGAAALDLGLAGDDANGQFRILDRGVL